MSRSGSVLVRTTGDSRGKILVGGSKKPPSFPCMEGHACTGVYHRNGQGSFAMDVKGCKDDVRLRVESDSRFMGTTQRGTCT
jgi:hypothetical protein